LFPIERKVECDEQKARGRFDLLALGSKLTDISSALSALSFALARHGVPSHFK
jgi:hypothetical protein